MGDGRRPRHSKDDVEKAYKSRVDPAAATSDEEVLGAKLNMLDELVNQDLLHGQGAAPRSIEATGTEIENAYAERRRNVPDAAFQLQLSQRGLTRTTCG